MQSGTLGALGVAITFGVVIAAGWSSGPETGQPPVPEMENAMMIPVEKPPETVPAAKPSDADLLNAEPLVAQATSVSTLSGGNGDGVGTLINLQGELCAKVVSVTKLKRHRYDIICEENRDGSGWVRHRLNAKDGSVTFVGRADSTGRL